MATEVRKTPGIDAVPDTVAKVQQTLPTDVVCIISREIAFEPVGNVENATSIQFKLSAGADEMFDPKETRIYWQLRLVKSAGGLFVAGDAEDDTCLLVDGIADALIKNVEVSINNKTLTNSDGLYHYRSNIERRIFYPTEIKKNELMSAGYYTYNKLSFDEATDAQRFGNAQFNEFKKRHNLVKQSRIVTVCSTLQSEIFDQPKFLPPQTEILVTLTKNPDSLLLLSKSDPCIHKILIVSCKLVGKFVRTDAEILNSIKKEVEKGDPYTYPIRKIEMMAFIKAPGITDLSISNLFPQGNILPRRVFIVLVKNAANDGHIQMDPFFYTDFDTSETCLKIAGESKPYANAQNEVSMLENLFKSIRGTVPHQFSIGINIENYKAGNYVLGWDLCPTSANPFESYNMPLTEQISLDLKLNTSLTNSTIVVVYSEFASEVRMDSNSNVVIAGA